VGSAGSFWSDDGRGAWECLRRGCDEAGLCAGLREEAKKKGRVGWLGGVTVTCYQVSLCAGLHEEASK
jgi:hypothetical protein